MTEFSSNKRAAIVVAGGSGTRFGAMKQFVNLFGLPVIAWSIYELLQVVGQIVLVVPKEVSTDYDKKRVLEMISDKAVDTNRHEVIGKYFCETDYQDEYLADVLSVVPGGNSRSESVRCGLQLVNAQVESVVIHDGARPLARQSLFSQVIAKIEEGYDGATCYLPVTDTIKSVTEDGNLTTLDRNKLIAVQTPQAFSLPILIKAHLDCPDATDDIALLEALGANVALVKGDSMNLKITESQDIKLFEYLVTMASAKSR
jgi:2-C-methyl-D-erythritol 4-phosphate cytidylyltransferase